MCAGDGAGLVREDEAAVIGEIPLFGVGDILDIG